MSERCSRCAHDFGFDLPAGTEVTCPRCGTAWRRDTALEERLRDAIARRLDEENERADFMDWMRDAWEGGT